MEDQLPYGAGDTKPDPAETFLTCYFLSENKTITKLSFEEAKDKVPDSLKES